MLAEPQISRTAAQRTAVIHLTVPREEIGSVMAPSIDEVTREISAQGVTPSGPLFARYLEMEPEAFELEVGYPVETSVEPSGRMKPGELPGGRVARAIYEGPYEGLHAAWAEFGEWIDTHGYKPLPGLWESYRLGPETNADPTAWRTELSLPLTD